MVDARTEPLVPRDLRELEVAYACVQPPTAMPIPSVMAPVAPETESPLLRRPLGIRGTRPGMGQSMVTLGLALAWASAGRRVLVIDLDPSEDLARLLHVGWALRPGNAHTVANVVRTRARLLPAPSLLAGITIASLGTMPGGHPSEVARGFARAAGPLSRILRDGFAEHDRVLVDLPAAAALASLEAVVDRWWVLDAVRSGARTLVQGAHAHAVPSLPSFSDHWSLIDGSVGDAVDQSFRDLAQAIDQGGTT